MADITIDRDTLERIKTKAGFPIVDEIILDDIQIKNFCVRESLEEYFRWFPKQATYQTNISGAFEVAFPDTYTFGVIDARLSNALSKLGTSLTGNRIADIIIGRQYNKESYYGGTYGVPYNFNGRERAREMTRQLRNVKISQRDNARVIVRIEDRKVKGFSASTSKLTIIWAKYSDDFSDIRFERKEEVIKLCQAYLLEHIADTIGLIDNKNLDLEIDTNKLQSKADDLRKEVIDLWREHKKILVVPKHTGIVSF